MTTSACRRLFGRRALLRFCDGLWRSLLDGLAERGGGYRESGAFLLGAGRRNGRTVERVVFFDDLDPSCLVGSIHLSGGAYPRLWDLCAQSGLRVIGDVHTHPGSGVRQSSIDAANPMVAARGHVALIVPNFARSDIAPSDVGVHVYLGDAGWRTELGQGARRALYVGRFA